MGSLLTTGKVTQLSTGGGVAANTVLPAGTEITGIPAGAVFLDFVAGTVTLPAGSPTPLTRPMSKNLNDLGLQQCNSIGIWCSDADATYQIGSAVSLADHQLNHVICNYGFSSATIIIPANSTPDASNQIFFQASTDGWLGYSFPRISHQRGIVNDADTDTTTDSLAVYLSKHVGAYNQFLITTENTDGANSLDVSIQYSEDGDNWFPTQGYGTVVTVTSGDYDAFASEVEHHFYRVLLKATSSGNQATYKIHYNFVNDRGSAFL